MFLAWTFLALAPFLSAGETAWHQTLTPHFVVKHESTFLPPGFLSRIERMHTRLRMDLWGFSPWMAKERINLYLYRSQQSYAAGEFQPPSWSNGISMHEIKTVAVFEQPDARALYEVLGHETTHLLFEGYWSDVKKTPPSWLNEGLAMMEEADSAVMPENSTRYQAMAYVDPRLLRPLAQFVAIRPSEDMQNASQEDVGLWYTEAYSLVTFLYRRHTNLQFKSFCARLRDGESVESAVRFVYHYRSLAELERDWRRWLASPIHRSRVDRVLARAKPGGEGMGAQPIQFEPIRHLGQ